MRDIYTGIDIGSDSVKIVISEFLDNRFDILASTNVRSAGIRKGLIYDKDLAVNSLKLAIKEIEPSIGVKIDKAIITVPSNDRRFSVVSGTTRINGEDSVVTGEDISSALEEAVHEQLVGKESLISIIPITFSVDDKEGVPDPRGLTGEYLEVKAVLAAAPRTNIIPFLEVFDECGIEVEDITFGSIGDYYESKTTDMDKNLGAIINVGSVLVILNASLTKFKISFDLLILTDDNIAKGIAIKHPIIDPNTDIFIVSTNGGNTSCA